MASDMKLNLILKATDGMSDIVRSACRQSDAEFEKMNKTLEATAGKFDDAGKRTAIFGGALVGLSTVNAKVAGDFEQGMNNVSTLIDTNTESVKDMSKEILQMAKNSPKAISDLTDGLYSIRSAGIEASQQFNVLHGSEMLSVAGLSTTAEAVDVTTSAINAFNLKGKEADKIYDMLFKVVKYGKTNISEIAQGFGSSAGVVAAANIKIDEYSASIAAMTTSGLKAANAHTQVKAAIAGLSRGSKEQMAIFNKLGAKSFGDLVNKSGGMVNAFNKINNAVGGNQAKLIQLVGSVEGYNAILSLTGSNNKTYLQTLNDMRNGGDALSEAYAKQTSGLNNQMAMVTNKLQTLSIVYGTALLPVITAAGTALGHITDVIANMPDGLVSFISIAAAGIGVVSLFGGTALMAVSGIIKNVIFLRNVMRAFSIAAWANPALLPIIGVTALIAGLAAGAVYCYNKFEGFRNMCQGTWAVIKAGGAWLSVLWQRFLTGASQVWEFIKPAVQFGIEILKWTTPIGLVIQGIQKLCGWIGTLVEKAGGFRSIGAKWKEWGETQTAKAERVNNEIKSNRIAEKANGNTNSKSVNIDGSHANGLNYVPYDGYIAQVHKGEAILTEDEAGIWRNGDNISTNTSNSISNPITIEFKPTVTIQNATKEAKGDFLQILRQYKNELVSLIEEVQSRRMARVY